LFPSLISSSFISLVGQVSPGCQTGHLAGRGLCCRRLHRCPARYGGSPASAPSLLRHHSRLLCLGTAHCLPAAVNHSFIHQVILHYVHCNIDPIGSFVQHLATAHCLPAAVTHSFTHQVTHHYIATLVTHWFIYSTHVLA